MNELQHCMNVNYEYRPYMDHYRKTQAMRTGKTVQNTEMTLLKFAKDV